jgi:hypothetical protein
MSDERVGAGLDAPMDSREKVLKDFDTLFVQFKGKPVEALIDRLSKCGIDSLGKLVDALDTQCRDKTSDRNRIERNLSDANVALVEVESRRKAARLAVIKHAENWEAR